MKKHHAPHYDRWTLFIVLMLIAFGLLMVSSASIVVSDQNYGYPFHYFVRQSIFATAGIVCALIAANISLEKWQSLSGFLLVMGLLMLAAVLVPGIGRVVNGSRRWIALGPIAIQVSEVIKLCMILYLASYISRYQAEVQTKLVGFIKPILILGLIGLLLLMEPDFGSSAVLSMTVLAMLFIAGARLLPFIVLFMVMASGLIVLAISSPYRLERLTTFLNPWHTPYTSGYQLTQSLIAFGRGGTFGVGLGNSVQKLYYLPEAHTDFIFAVIAEELGLVGELGLIALFVILVLRIFMIARKAHRQNKFFGAFFCYGAGVWLGMQTLINIGVNTGVLPTKGLTLPFISYGGSSLLIMCVLVAIVLRVSYETSVVASESPMR